MSTFSQPLAAEVDRRVLQALASTSPDAGRRVYVTVRGDKVFDLCCDLLERPSTRRTRRGGHAGCRRRRQRIRALRPGGRRSLTMWRMLLVLGIVVPSVATAQTERLHAERDPAMRITVSLEERRLRVIDGEHDTLLVARVAGLGRNDQLCRPPLDLRHPARSPHGYGQGFRPRLGATRLALYRSGASRAPRAGLDFRRHDDCLRR